MPAETPALEAAIAAAADRIETALMHISLSIDDATAALERLVASKKH